MRHLQAGEKRQIADDVTCLTALPDTQWVEEVKIE
jgi:hypothetical protein